MIEKSYLYKCRECGLTWVGLSTQICVFCQAKSLKKCLIQEDEKFFKNLFHYELRKNGR